MPSSRTPFTFRIMLTSILLGMLIFAVGLLGFASLHFANKTVNELADTIVQQTLRQTEMRVQTLIRTATAQNEINLRLTPTGQLGAADFGPLFDRLAPAFEVRAELSYLGLALEATGEYCMLERLPDGTVRIREYVDGPDGKRVIRDYRPVPGGRELVRTLPWDGYDPRTRPFYQKAQAEKRPTWTDSYAFWSGNERGQVPGLTHAVPVLDHQGRLRAVWDVDFDTFALCSFLKSLKHELPGDAFVVEQGSDGSRRIVAHPNPELLLDPQSHLLLTNFSLLRDPAAQALLSLAPGSVGDLAKAVGNRVEIRASGVDYLAGTRLLGGEDSPRWLIATLLPRERVMGQVRENRRWAFTTLLLGMALAFLAAIRISNLTARPLKQLQHEAEAIGRLELAPLTSSPSRIREIKQLSNAVDEMKTNLRSFRKYVPADVVGELVRSGREATLGGQTCTVTIYFSDIEGFTAASENMTPAALVNHLGEYLGAMSANIARHHGTVDKFIGDAVMAFWNAPRPNTKHALDACLTALDNQQTLAELRAGWLAADKPLWKTRIALHSGEVVVGNIGSEGRLNYTIIGDSVNLASRLEKVNQAYGTSILISEATRELAGSGILARPLDRVAVRGKVAGVTCFELVARAESATANQREWCAATTAAFAAYLAADFSAAEQNYREVLTLVPQDRAAALLLTRCQILQREPPQGDWQGLYAGPR